MTFGEWWKDLWVKARESLYGGDSNFKLAASYGYGIFWGIIPLWGYQTIITIGTAHFLKLNKVVAVLGSLISLPPFIPFIIWGCYWTGCRILGHPLIFTWGDITLKNVGSCLLEYSLGSIIVAIGAALVFTLIGWGILSMFRKASDNDYYN